MPPESEITSTVNQEESIYSILTYTRSCFITKLIFG